VRDLIACTLERSGCRALAAEDVAEACLQAESTEVDVLLTELAPRFDGASIADRLRTRFPRLSVLYVTGWFDHPDFVLPRGEAVLRKPFSRDELVQAIEEVGRRNPEVPRDAGVSRRAARRGGP
jgi:DNA-binding response OmpR family regulator